MVAKVRIKKENEIPSKVKVDTIRQPSGNGDAHILENNVMYYVTRNIMNRLDDGWWLNDEIIIFYMKLLEIYSTQNTELKVRCQKTGFMDKILQHKNDINCYNHESMRRWMHEWIADFDIIFYPINITQWCWALAQKLYSVLWLW